MKKSFTGELLSGHKQDAVEVPFDPGVAWKIESRPLWRGRRGFRVKARIKGRTFDTSIVPRQKKFYLLIEPELVKAAGLAPGDSIRATVEPAT
ncbi:MAG TPA: DUF1905 domain-containing protein [Pyrinomonadaceae bacterium]|nr:DUF1905 domain-containing protein [Pyrinomonadaceae bacterium]